jgi:hypothetical protein
LAVSARPRLLSYKGIDALGVAITDPIRATTPLFSAMMAIIFSARNHPSSSRYLMIMAGIILCRGATVR